MKPHDFLSIINSNSVVILKGFGDIDRWKPVWPGLTFQGHSRSKTMAPNETSCMSSHPSSIVTLWLSWKDLEIEAIETEQKINGHTCCPLSFLSAPSLKEIQPVLFELQLQVCLHPRWPPGRHFEWYQKSIQRAYSPGHTWSWSKQKPPIARAGAKNE